MTPGRGVPGAWGPAGGWDPGTAPNAGMPPTGWGLDPRWNEPTGPVAGTMYGSRPPGSGRGARRRSGDDGGPRTPALVMVGSVIGVAAVLAIAVWLLLFRSEDGGTASVSPAPAATVRLTPPPTETPRVEPTAEALATPRPEPTRFRNPTFSGLRIDDAERLARRNAVILEVTYEVTDEAERDTVISQDPPPGQAVLPGDVIRLTVAAPQPTVPVPDLRGVTEEDAIAALLDAELAPGARTEAFDPDVEAGLIVRTDPRGGIQVVRGTPVDYHVSRGARPTPPPTPQPTALPVPDLLGLAEADARAIAGEAGLAVDVTPRESDDGVPGTVLAQDPPPGTPVLPGSTVSVVVVGRSATVEVPDVRGLAEAEAIGALLDADLALGARAEAWDPDLPPGLVLRTDPRPGIRVARGTVVEYIVSLGREPTPTVEPTDAPGPVQVPNLRDLPEPDAVTTLLEASLQPGERSERYHASVAAGSVIRSDPAAGTIVALDTAVDYTVSLGPQPTTEPTLAPGPTASPIVAPDLVGLRLDDARAFADSLGIPLAVEDRQTGEAAPDTVLDQDPDSGTVLGPGDAIRILVARAPTAIPVPDLHLLSEQDGIALLAGAGLDAGRRIERYNDLVPAGAVVRTDPPAGTLVAPGSSIDYVVSRGPEPGVAPALVVVPALEGLSLSDAAAQADTAGLVLDVVTREVEGVAPDTVVEQDPPAGTPVETGSSVRVTVAAAPGGVPVPRIRGLSEPDGLVLLAEAGLVPGQRIDRYNDQVPADTIVRTDPPAGTVVPQGSTVDYVLSLGPEAVATAAPGLVPDLVGLTRDEAEARARDAGLELDVIGEVTSDVPDGIVIAQDPPPGTPLVVDRVTVVVARAPSTIEVPRLRGLSEQDAMTAVIAAGLVPGVRSERYHAEIAAGFVLGSDPRPGELVDPGTPIAYTVSLGPPPAVAPSAPPAPEDTPEPPLPTPGVIQGPTAEAGTAGQLDPALAGTLDEVVAGVSALRGLGPGTPLTYRSVGPKDLRAEVRARWLEDHDPALLAAESRALARLGLLPDGADVGSIALDAVGARIGAWYDPRTGSLAVTQRGASFDAVELAASAHAAAHALTAQTFGSGSLDVADPSQGDRVLARLALEEGDAIAATGDFTATALSVDPAAPIPTETTPDVASLGGLPLVVRRALEFPSGEGRAFVDALRAAGGWAAVDAAWGRPPASTEQVLHPERYPSDRPVKVALPDLSGVLGGGWSTAWEQTMGELRMAVWLADGQDPGPAFGAPLALANASAAEGWGGDRLASLDGPDGAWLVVWQTAWDSDADAAEFGATASAVAADLRPHAVIAADLAGGLPYPVLVLIASDQGVIDALVGILGIAGA